MVSETLKVKLKIDSSELEKAIRGAIANPLKGVGGGGVVGGATELAGKGAVAGAAIGAISAGMAGIGKLVDLFAEASPMFKGMLKILTLALNMFLMPIANFFATLLMPVAIALLKFSIWFQKTLGKPLQDLAKYVIDFFNGLTMGFKQMLEGDWSGIIKGIGEYIEKAISAYGKIFDIAAWLTIHLVDFIAKTTFNLVDWLKELILGIFGIKPTNNKELAKELIDTVKDPIGKVADVITNLIPGFKTLKDKMDELKNQSQTTGAPATTGVGGRPDWLNPNIPWVTLPPGMVKTVDEYGVCVDTANTNTSKLNTSTGILNTTATKSITPLVNTKTAIGNIGDTAKTSKTAVDNLIGTINLLASMNPISILGKFGTMSVAGINRGGKG
jgi:hypothetical protein